MAKFSDSLKKWFFGKSDTGEGNLSGTSKMLRKLVNSVYKTQEVEYDCNQVYELLDQYVEMVNRGEDAAQLMPLVKQHLELCKDCREEFEALKHVMEYHSEDMK
jgi:hypothetical protein